MPSRGDSTAFPIRSVKHHRPDRKAYRGGPQRVETSENSREDPPLSGTQRTHNCSPIQTLTHARMHAQTSNILRQSPASESDSSSVSGAKSPAGPPLLQHLLQLQLQGQNPQAITQAVTEMCVQFQQMIAALAALGTGLVPPLSQAWMMQKMMTRPQADRS
ncbi:hypothetical protein KGM_204076A, partial [Danaus plexippus plexippus]